MGREVDSPRTIPGGSSVPDGTLALIYKKTDLVTPVASVAVAGGKYDHRYDGSYGPIETRVTYSGETRIRDSWSIGQAGPMMMSDFPYLLQVLGHGVVGSVGHKLQVTAGGAGRTVLVRDGVGAAAGVSYNQATDNKPSPTFGTNASGNPRIDLIGFQTWAPGHAEEGRAELAILQGTPAPVPVAPTPTQNAAGGTWFEPLAEVTLANGYSTITAGNIKDVRRYLGQPGRVLVATIPFSGASGVADGVFTGDFRNYEVDINIDTATLGGALRMLLRAAGVSFIGAVQDWSLSGRDDAGVSVVANGNNDDHMNLSSAMDTTPDVGCSMTFFDPQRTRQTRISFHTTYADAANSMEDVSGGAMVHNTLAYDGFVILSGAGGVLTGEIRVYGKGS